MRAICLAVLFASACRSGPEAPRFEFRNAACTPSGLLTELTCAASLVAIGPTAARDSSIYVAIEEIRSLRENGLGTSRHTDTTAYMVQLVRGVAAVGGRSRGAWRFDVDSIVTTYRVVGYTRDTTTPSDGPIRLSAHMGESSEPDSVRPDENRVRILLATVLSVGISASESPPFFARVRLVRPTTTAIVVDSTTAQGRDAADLEAYWQRDTLLESLVVLRGSASVGVPELARPALVGGGQRGQSRYQVQVVRQTLLTPLKPTPSITVRAMKENVTSSPAAPIAPA